MTWQTSTSSAPQCQRSSPLLKRLTLSLAAVEKATLRLELSMLDVAGEGGCGRLRFLLRPESDELDGAYSLVRSESSTWSEPFWPHIDCRHFWAVSPTNAGRCRQGRSTKMKGEKSNQQRFHGPRISIMAVVSHIQKTWQQSIREPGATGHRRARFPYSSGQRMMQICSDLFSNNISTFCIAKGSLRSCG